MENKTQRFKVGDKIEARLLHNDLNPEMLPEVENWTVEEVKDGEITAISRVEFPYEMVGNIGTHKMLDKVKLIEPEIVNNYKSQHESYTKLGFMKKEDLKPGDVISGIVTISGKPIEPIKFEVIQGTTGSLYLDYGGLSTPIRISAHLEIKDLVLISRVNPLSAYTFTDLNSIRNIAYIRKDTELYQAVDAEIEFRYNQIKNLCSTT